MFNKKTCPFALLRYVHKSAKNDNAIDNVINITNIDKMNISHKI